MEMKIKMFIEHDGDKDENLYRKRQWKFKCRDGSRL